ncbi:MAG: hypothetical protein ACRCSI_04520 [Eubacterium aggregans]
MAITSGYWDGGGCTGEAEWNRYHNAIIEDGVEIEKATNEMGMKVTAMAGGVSVSPGYAIIDGTWIYNDTVHTIALAPGVNPYYARIVARKTFGTKNGSLETKTGSSTPDVTRDASMREISLAIVKVEPSGAVGITDTRGDESVCGAIRPRVVSGFKELMECSG